jgi:THO complex subunit 2
MTSAFTNCLDSRDYMHVRNALAVLEKIIAQYPLVDFQAKSLEEKVDIIAGKDETRGDLQIRAQGYLALLRKSSKSWVSQAKFSSKAASSPAYSPLTKRDSTPSASTATLRAHSSLNPAATPFNPTEGISRYLRSQLVLTMIRSEDRSAIQAEGLAPRVDTPKMSDMPIAEERHGTTTTSGKMHRKDPIPTSIQESKSSLSNRSPAGRLDNTSSQSIVTREDLPRSPRTQSGSKAEEALAKRSAGSILSTSSGQRAGHPPPNAPSSTLSQAVGVSQETNESSRSRIGGGPRNVLDMSQASNHRSTVYRDQHQSQRQPSRPASAGTLAPPFGFRGPPPTGPRASTVSTPSNPSGTGVPISRQQQPPQLRASGQSDPKKLVATQDAKPLPSVTPKVDSIPAAPAVVDPERRDSSSAAERGSRKPSDSQKLPADQHSAKSNLHDDDRRLPRPTDVSRDRITEANRLTRTSIEDRGSVTSATKDSASGTKHRSGREREERTQSSNDGRKDSEPLEPKESRRSRMPTRSDTNEREVTARSRGTATATLERGRPTVSEVRPVAPTGGHEVKDNGPHEPKEGQPIEKRGSHREKSDSLQRDQKDGISKDQKSSGYRDDDGAKRRDERDASNRRRDDPRESRHERPRDSHHERGTSRQSPTRTVGERGNEKRERERETERRSSNRRDGREGRDSENREKDKSSREADHRRDERERSGRERESESRRGSRKHERDRSSDMQDRRTRSGNGETAVTNESNKRRRVLR